MDMIFLAKKRSVFLFHARDDHHHVASIHLRKNIILFLQKKKKYQRDKCITITTLYTEEYKHMYIKKSLMDTIK